MLQQSMALWIEHYGYPAIFFLLVGGIIGLPVPDQMLLIVAGYLVLTKCLAFVPTVVAAALGSIAGITLSYALGRKSGSYFSKFRIVALRLERAQQCVHRFGAWSLILGYFVPGVRNLIGFASGMMKLRLRWFAPYAYAGAIVSSLTCVCAGYFLGTEAGRVTAAAGRVTAIALASASLFLILRMRRSGVPDTVNRIASPTTIIGSLE